MKNKEAFKKITACFFSVLFMFSAVFCVSVSTTAASSVNARASSKTALPSSPKLKSFYNKSDGIDVRWNKVSGAKSYRVYRRTAGNKWVFLGEITGTTYKDKQVKNESGVLYRYTVRARSYNGKLSKYTGLNDGACIRRLATPQMKSARNYTGGVQVSWGSVKGATGYKVYRKVLNGKWQYLETVKGTTYIDKAVKDENGTTYYYTARAVNGRFLSYFEGGVATKTVPTPQMKSARNYAGGVQVSWGSVKGATSYKIYRKVLNGKWQYLETIKGTTYIDKAKLDNDTVYYYTARAINGKTLSYFESGVSVKVVYSPVMKSVNNTKEGVSVTWEAVPGADSYKVYRKIEGDHFKYITSVNGTEYLDKEVADNEGVTYRYTVRAVNEGVLSYYESGLAIRVESLLSNLEKAKKEYGITEVIINTSQETLQDDLFKAALEKTSPCIVYVPGGRKYVIDKDDVFKRGSINAGYRSGIFVPKNVVLVAEKDTIFSMEPKVVAKEPKDAIQRFILICGSVYGGTYKGNDNCQFVLQFRNDEVFETASNRKQINGNIENTFVSGALYCGIKAIGSKNIVIEKNTVENCLTQNACGIGVMYGAEATSISNNKVMNVGSNEFGSGIDVTHANAKRIDNNVILNAAGHGISTDTDQKNKPHKYVKIGSISGNTIKNCTCHGIWFEDRCQVDILNSNLISDNKQCGVACEGLNPYENNANYTIKEMSNNKILNNVRSNLSVVGEYAKVTIISNNQISGSKEMIGIVLDGGAEVIVTGSNNKITNNAGYGVYLKNQSVFKITSSGKNYITGNGKYAIGFYNKSSAEISNADLSGNTKGSAYVGCGSTFKHKNCKVEKVVNDPTP